MILGIAHIAVAVENIDKSLKFWQKDLGLCLEGIEEVQSEGVKTAFLSSGKNLKMHIELLEALQPESPVGKFIARLGRGGIHHIAFFVDDIEKEIVNFVSKGYQFVNPLPRHGAHNTRIAFLHPKSCEGVLIELVQQE